MIETTNVSRVVVEQLSSKLNMKFLKIRILKMEEKKEEEENWKIVENRSARAELERYRAGSADAAGVRGFLDNSHAEWAILGIFELRMVYTSLAINGH